MENAQSETVMNNSKTKFTSTMHGNKSKVDGSLEERFMKSCSVDEKSDDQENRNANTVHSAPLRSHDVAGGRACQQVSRQGRLEQAGSPRQSLGRFVLFVVCYVLQVLARTEAHGGEARTLLLNVVQILRYKNLSTYWFLKMVSGYFLSSALAFCTV